MFVLKNKFFCMMMIFIVILSSFAGWSYADDTLHDEVIARFDSSFTVSENTEKNMLEWRTELLKKLKDVYNYDGNTITEKMAMATTVNIVKESSNKYTIRIRK